jgi:predicted nucleic acid-binding protein
VKRIDITDPIFEKAIEVKATNRLSVCDSWIVATAVSTNSILVHKDPEFEQVGAIIRLETLPYKPAGVLLDADERSRTRKDDKKV